MLCPYCGQEHPDDVKFCPATGRKLEIASFCMHCGTKLQPGWTFCPACGQSAGSAPSMDTSRSTTQMVYPHAPTKFTTWAAWGFVAILAIALILILIDPFQLRLIGRLSGNYDAAASAMPAETDLYMGINLLNARPDQMERLAPLGLPFMNLFGDELQSSLPETTGEGGMPSAGTLAQIDQAIQSEFGITLSQDVSPWIGQYLGFGLVGLSASGGQSEPRIIMAVEARSPGRADAFLERLAKGITEKQNVQFDKIEYTGVKIYTQRSSEEESQMVFGRSGRMVLFATGLETIQQAIDAQNNTSLADDPAFRELLQNLPRQSFARLYLRDATIDQAMGGADLYTSLALNILAPLIAIPAWSGSMLSVSQIDAGLQIDVFNAFDPQELSETERRTLEGGTGESRLINKIPFDTIAYISGDRLDVKWDSVVRTLASQTGEGADTYVNMLEQELGFDPGSDFFTYLDGEWMLSIVPSDSGELAQKENIKLGYFFIAEVEEGERLRNTLQSLLGGSSAQSFRNFVPLDIDNGIVYEAYGYGGNFPLFAYGINQGYFVVGSSGKLIKEMFNSQRPISESDIFRQVLPSLPAGTPPTFFMDVQGLLKIIRQGQSENDLRSFDETARYLEPIDWLAAAGSPLKGNISRSTLLIAIPEK
jgi:hypothetical protein